MSSRNLLVLAQAVRAVSRSTIRGLGKIVNSLMRRLEEILHDLMVLLQELLHLINEVV